MDNYYVNKHTQSAGEHEVHKEECHYLPGDKIYLGLFSTCHKAVRQAEEYYSNVDGCTYCCSDCHFE